MTAEITTDDLLAGYAAGRLAEPVALIVATHLSLNRVQARRFAAYEALGGVLFEGIEPEPVSPDSWERLAYRLDGEPIEKKSSAVASELPCPLSDYVKAPLSRLRWSSYGAIAEVALDVPSNQFRTKLIKVKAGRSVPRHTHDGQELTLVLEGGFSDGRGHYCKGDLVIADRQVDHSPTADDECDCLCLAVTNAPLRLTGAFTRLLNPFINL